MSQMKTYSDYVKLGKSLLRNVEVYQVHIAFFATQVCQISHGGAIGRKLYTLKDYARDIGMNNKTLSEWVNTYRVVIEKLDIPLDEITAKDWQVANRVLCLLQDERRAINEANGTLRKKNSGWKIGTPKSIIKDLFDRNYDKRGVQSDIHKWTDTVIFIKNKLISIDLSEASVSSLISLKENLDKASDTVLDHLMNQRKETITTISEQLV